jgi:hypothetical protein
MNATSLHRWIRAAKVIGVTSADEAPWSTAERIR